MLWAAAAKKAGTVEGDKVAATLDSSLPDTQGVIKLYHKPFSKGNHEALSVADLLAAIELSRCSRLRRLGDEAANAGCAIGTCEESFTTRSIWGATCRAARSVIPHTPGKPAWSTSKAAKPTASCARC